MENMITISAKDLIYIVLLIISVVSSYSFLRSDVKTLAKDKVDKLDFEKKLADLKESFDKRITELGMNKAESQKVNIISEEFIGMKKDLATILNELKELKCLFKEVDEKLDKHINEEKK